MWKQFFTTLAAVVLGGGGLGYYFRDRWTHRLSKELVEHQTKYAWLHTERAQILLELYRLLSKADRMCDQFLNASSSSGTLYGTPKPEQIWNEANETLGRFIECAEDNEALLQPTLVQQLNDLQKKYLNVLYLSPPFGEPPAIPAKIREFRVHIDPLREEIQKTIQKMLGVE